MTLSLSLGVRRPSDAKTGLSADAASRKRQFEETLHRDDHTCQCCGFQSRQFQQVAPVEGKLVTLCTFCEQCFSLDAVGLSGSGTLIWLPEISQQDLNHLARAIYVAKAEKNSPIAEVADRALNALLSRRADAKRRLGSDDPLLLATVFFENLSDDDYDARADKLEGVRLMPLDKKIVASRTGDIDVFPRMVAYWRSEDGPYAEVPVKDWMDLFGSVSGA